MKDSKFANKCNFVTEVCHKMVHNVYLRKYEESPLKGIRIVDLILNEL